jgi:hypothetical protein
MVASGRRYQRRGGPLGGLRLPPDRATGAADDLPALGVAARTAGARLRVAPFVVLGGTVSTYLAVVVLTRPIGVTPHPHCLAYHTGVQHEIVWAVLYIVAVIGPALMSGYPSIVAFGVLNLIGLVAVAALYYQAFASLWCIYAAVMSVLVLVHMVRRRRLPDPHRYRSVAPVPPVPTHI